MKSEFPGSLLCSQPTTDKGLAGAHADLGPQQVVPLWDSGDQMCAPIAGQVGKETKGLPTGVATTESVTAGRPKQATSLRLHGRGGVVVAECRGQRPG